MIKKDTTFMIIMACSFVGLFLICMIFSWGMTGGEESLPTEPTEESTTTASETTESSATEETTSTTAGKYYVITLNSDAINIRSGPGMEFGKIGTAFAGDRYLYMGEEKATDGKLWYHIQTSYITGWIGSQFCNKTEIDPSELEDLLNPRTTRTTTSTSKTTTTTETETSAAPTETTASVEPTQAPTQPSAPPEEPPVTPPVTPEPPTPETPPEEAAE